MRDLRLTLVDPNEALCDAWRRHFPAGIDIHCGFFQEIVGADALVTAGNSFGIMDGGVDLAVSRAFPGVEDRIRDRIRERHYGELLVGTATIAPTIRESPQYVVYAPTMRVPLSIVGTDAVYRAMWAALTEVGRHNRRCYEHEQFWTSAMAIKTLLVPGLGTGAGRMPPDEAARQMAVAWRNFNAAPESTDWVTVSARHHEIAGTACCQVESSRC